MKKTEVSKVKKPGKKVTVRTEPVEQPPAKVVEAVQHGVAEVAANPPEKIHHVHQ